MSCSKKFKYRCEVWSSSTNLANLKLWVFLLPLSLCSTGLSTRIKRFTLLRSPLGNKTSKDQFEKQEYRTFLSVESTKVPKILSFIEVLSRSSGIKYKVKIVYKFKRKN